MGPPVAGVENQYVGVGVGLGRRLHQVQAKRLRVLPAGAGARAFSHQEGRAEELDRAIVILRVTNISITTRPRRREGSSNSSLDLWNAYGESYGVGGVGAELAPAGDLEHAAPLPLVERVR